MTVIIIIKNTIPMTIITCIDNDNESNSDNKENIITIMIIMMI